MKGEQKKNFQVTANDLPTIPITVGYEMKDHAVTASPPEPNVYTETFTFTSPNSTVQHGGRILDLRQNPSNIKWICRNPFAIVFMTRYCYRFFDIAFGQPYSYWAPTEFCHQGQGPWAAVQSVQAEDDQNDVVFLKALDNDDGSDVQLVYAFLPLYEADTLSTLPGDSSGRRHHNKHHGNRLLRAVIQVAS